jgi:uncharacterized membrane protein SirB2
MIKHLHLTFVLLSLLSFVGRVVLAQIRPAILQQKAMKIAPHVINTILLLSGMTLVFQGSWLSGEYAWIIAKIVVLFGYVGLGILTFRLEGQQRWQAFGGAMLCFIYIAMAAVTKHVFLF